MDWGWLGGLFKNVMGVFRFLTRIKFSRIWRAVFDLVQRIRGWYRWYQANVQKPLQAGRANFRKLYDQFVLPIVKMVDLIRRITGVVGLFNKRLAGKLNLLFLRIEEKLLLPLQLYNKRIAEIGRMFSGFLTPLGYFDRATLLNSIWRDAKHLRALMHVRLPGDPAPVPIPAAEPFLERVKLVKDCIGGKDTEITPAVRDNAAFFRGLLDAAAA